MAVGPLHWRVLACTVGTGSFRMAYWAEVGAQVEGAGTGTAAHLAGEVASAGGTVTATVVKNNAR